MSRRRSRGPRLTPASPALPAPRDAVGWRVGVLLLATALIYANSLSGPFIFDDRASISGNASIRTWSADILSPAREVPTAGRPVVNVSLAINFALGGFDVRGYHLWNIAMHLLCTTLVFGCVRRTLEMPRIPPALRQRSIVLSFAAALLWALHPLNTEVVDYVTERSESMMALCYLLTFYAGARAIGSPRPWRWHAVAVTACAIGMACKESMVTAPVMLWLYDRTFVFRSFREALRERWPLYAGLAATWIVLAATVRSGPRMHSAGFSTAVNPWAYLLNQTLMIAHYLRLIVWPRGLVVLYGPPQPLTLLDVWPYAVLVGILLTATVLALKYWPLVGFVGAWVFITLAPTSSIVPIATEVGAERRMYLPLAAVAALAVTGTWLIWHRLAPRRASRGLPLVFWIIALSLAAGTIARNREYRSQLTLAQTVLARWPSSFAHALVGTALAADGRHDEAIAELRLAAPTYVRARYHLGGELFNRGALDEAIEHLQEFVRLEPILAEAVPARMMIGRARMQQRRWPEAVEQFRLVLSMTPALDEAHTTAIGFLADSLFAQEQFDEARTYYAAYLSARPSDGGAMTNLAISLAAIGRREEAVAAFRRAADLRPTDARARVNLGRALAEHGDLNAARVELERAVQLDPANAEVRQELDVVLRALVAKR